MTGRVLVLGSINVDLLASVPRLPGPGETLTGTGFVRLLGGKGANQAVAASRAEAATLMIGATGSDADGAAMLKALVGYGVDTSRIARSEEPTGCALVVTSPSDNQIVVVPGANHALTEELVADVDMDAADVCLTQLETPSAVAACLFRRARTAGATTILNAAPANDGARVLLPLTDILIVNETELGILADVTMPDDPADEVLLRAISSLTSAYRMTVIVTLGARGLLIVSDDGQRGIPGRTVEVVDTTGAGDCFCGYLAAGLARGARLDDAVAEANVAASIAVQSLGAASSVPPRSTILDTFLVQQNQGL